MLENDVMSRGRLLSAFLILLLLFSAFAATHHHHHDEHDEADHRDCSICVVRHHQPATSQSPAAFNHAPCFIEAKLVPLSTVFIENILISFLKNRAPPA